MVTWRTLVSKGPAKVDGWIWGRTRNMLSRVSIFKEVWLIEPNAERTQEEGRPKRDPECETQLSLPKQALETSGRDVGLCRVQRGAWC